MSFTNYSIYWKQISWRQDLFFLIFTLICSNKVEWWGRLRCHESKFSSNSWNLPGHDLQKTRRIQKKIQAQNNLYMMKQIFHVLFNPVQICDNILLSLFDANEYPRIFATLSLFDLLMGLGHPQRGLLDLPWCLFSIITGNTASWHLQHHGNVLQC